MTLPDKNRNPYTVPDGFFHDFEQRMAEMASTKPSTRLRPMNWLRLSAGIAAAIAVVCAVAIGMARHDYVSYPEVIDAFDGLADDDREALLTYYQDDIFLN